MERIVVAAKAGADQPWLAEAAADLAAQSNAVVDVVSADDLDSEAFSTVPRDGGRRAGRAVRRGDRRAPARRGHRSHRPHPARAVVRSVLLFAEDHDADLIVCGASTRGRIARRLLGDTPIELIQRARRPVLVITPPSGRE